MSLHQDSIDLAKEVEIWLAKLRYKDEKINNEIPIEILFRLNEFHRELVIYSSLFETIKTWVERFSKQGPAPEHIKNRILMIETFRQDF